MSLLRFMITSLLLWTGFAWINWTKAKISDYMTKTLKVPIL